VESSGTGAWSMVPLLCFTDVELQKREACENMKCLQVALLLQMPSKVYVATATDLLIASSHPREMLPKHVFIFG
jgi:hypothetical protein